MANFDTLGMPILDAGSDGTYVDPLLIPMGTPEPRVLKPLSEADKKILARLTDTGGKPPTWASIFNQWYATENLPWQNSVQGTDTSLADFKISENGTIIPNSTNPLWLWNTGADTAAAKQMLDQRYLDALDAYNKQNGTDYKPDTSVLGVNAQPNSTYRAPDEGSFLSNIVGGVGSAIGNATETLGDWAKKAADNPIETSALLAAAYYGGPAALEALQTGAAATPAEALSGLDLGGAGASPASWLNAGDFSGALPAGAAYVAPEIGAGTQLAELAPTTVSDAGVGSTLGEVATGNADKAALYGDAGYGAGMTGAQTAAYDTGLAAGGAAAAAAAGAGGGAAAGTALADILPYTTGASVVGSLLQADAAKSAADQQSAAAQAAIAQQQKNFETINAQQAPYRGAGYQGLNAIRAMLPGNNVIYDEQGKAIGTGVGSDYLTHQFNAADLKAGLAPNYDFMLQQGQMANQRAGNMGGGALGGNVLQGLNKYTQDYAGNAYQNAFSNYQNQRTNIYNTLAGIAGIGQTGQNATNTAATNATNAASQLGVGSAAAQAAGTVGSANAYGNALNNVTNQYTLAALLNQGGRIG